MGSEAYIIAQFIKDDKICSRAGSLAQAVKIFHALTQHGEDCAIYHEEVRNGQRIHVPLITGSASDLSRHISDIVDLNSWCEAITDVFNSIEDGVFATSLVYELPEAHNVFHARFEVIKPPEGAKCLYMEYDRTSLSVTSDEAVLTLFNLMAVAAGGAIVPSDPTHEIHYCAKEGEATA